MWQRILNFFISAAPKSKHFGLNPPWFNFVKVGFEFLIAAAVKSKQTADFEFFISAASKSKHFGLNHP